MFQRTSEEIDDLRSRSQIATLKKHRPIGFIQPGDDKDKNSKS